MEGNLVSILVMKCPICKRTFASPQALAQHRQAKHNARSATPTKKQPKSSVVTASHERLVISKGFCGTARLENTDSSGDVVFIQQVSPEVLHDTLISSRFRLKARWRPTRWRYHIESGLSALVNGIMGGVWVPDTNLIPVGEAGLPWLMSQKHKSVFNVRDGGVVQLPTETEFKWLDTDPTQINGHHGYLVLFVVSPIGGLETGAEFIITVEAEVEMAVDKPPAPVHGGTGSSFSIRCFQGHSTVAGNNLAVLVQQGTNLFQTNVVYELDPPLEVRLDNGTRVPATHGVRKVAGLVRPEVFLTETESEARQLAATPDSGFSPFCIVGTTWTSTEWETILVTEVAAPVRVTQGRAPATSNSCNLSQVALGGELATALLAAAQALLKITEEPRTIVANLAGEVAMLPADLTLEGEIS